MVVRRTGDEAGQSVIEFLLLFPMLVGLTTILVRVNSVIQMSIVNQQYSRAQAHWLAFNSAIYPERGLRDTYFVQKGYNQMMLGVSDNTAPPGETYVPEAMKGLIARSKKFDKAGDDPRAEDDEKATVRIRNTVTLCTQSNFFKGKNGNEPIEKVRQGVTPASFSYCRGGLE